MAEVQKLYFIFIIYIAIFQSEGETKIQCYNCYYSESDTSIPGSDKNCLSKDLGDHLNDNIEEIGDFVSCFSKVKYEKDRLVGAVRGGSYYDLELGPAVSNRGAVGDSSPFDTETYILYRCESELCNNIPHSMTFDDYCNGASSFGQIFFFVLLTGALVFFRDLKIVPSLFI
ncbi:UNVERIFIED_CONTAM: hypothetical protein RMT77_000996 [Armadillidium vulgare]